MIVIHHRRNTVAELADTDPQFGVEIDLRNHGDDILVTHDPFITRAVLLQDWLKQYRHRFLIANVKEEGLEPRLTALLAEYGVSDFFILDESIPLYVNMHLRDCQILRYAFQSLKVLKQRYALPAICTVRTVALTGSGLIVLLVCRFIQMKLWRLDRRAIAFALSHQSCITLTIRLLMRRAPSVTLRR
ncbi:hypothetical protein HED54_12165 [Ochrobactrum anthropi ATCC 49188]|nr:hypothetical protein [Brucella anthropi ATCC 49188]